MDTLFSKTGAPGKAVFAAALMLLSSAITVDVLADGLNAIRVIPTPQQIVAMKGRFAISSETKIVLGSNSREEQFAAQQINDELAGLKAGPLPVRAGGTLTRLPASFIYLGTPASKHGAPLLKERSGVMKPEMAEEGYILDVRDNGIIVIAESGKGKFYGVMTLLQMMRREGGAIVVDGATVADYPHYKLRGISDDISRGQVSTPDNFRKIIRFLARYKMNMYSPYIEDMFVFKNHPLIGKGRGALTSREMKELDAYAKQYYVDIVPIFQTLGHWENILAIPEYVGYAEYPGGRTVNVSDEKVYALLDEMIGEISGSFGSPYFNMAADETQDVGLGANKELVAKRGLPAVLADHYKRVASIVRRYGKTPMIYGDMILKNPEILELIPKDIIIVDWNYDPLYQYESPKVFKKAGFPFLVSPAVRNYRGPFLDYLNSFENIERFSRAGYEDGSLGLLISSWNDYGGEELRELNYYGYAWGAECGWHPSKSGVVEFNRAFFKDFFGSGEADPLQAAYAILSSPANHFTWYELWRHPMLPFMPPTPQKGHSPLIMERLQSIESTMPFVISLLEKARPRVLRNKDHLRYIEFVARLSLWFSKKVQVGELVQELSKHTRDLTQRDSVAKVVVALCSDVVKDLAQLRSEFGNLWLTTNKPEGLEYLMMRYDRQMAFWQEKIDQVRRGEFWVNPEIESGWIYHTDAKPGAKGARQVQHAYFRKAFSLPQSVSSAALQVIGDTYATVSVNGNEIGEVHVRRSNSLSAEHQRIKMFDIRPFLTPMANVIAVEVRDFSVAGSAGVNIYCELQMEDGAKRTVLSDTTWKVADTAGDLWRSVSYDDSSWTHAVVRPYPYTVVRPDVATRRNSWIEQ